MSSGEQPFVSIGMPLYNAEQYLQQALDSLLSQDYQHFELIISDNGSTDGTARICMEYAARDNRIPVFIAKRSKSRRNLELQACLQDWLRLPYFMWGPHDATSRTRITSHNALLLP